MGCIEPEVKWLGRDAGQEEAGTGKESEDLAVGPDGGQRGNVTGAASELVHARVT